MVDEPENYKKDKKGRPIAPEVFPFKPSKENVLKLQEWLLDY